MAEVKVGKSEVAELSRQTRSGVEPFARLGYAVNGAVYFFVGVLALRAALGFGSANVDREEALLQIAIGPFGRILMVVVMVGLLGYSLGHLFMAARSRGEEKGRGLFSLANRGAHAVTAMIHFGMALTAGQLLWVGWLRGDETRPEDWTALLMSFPPGRWLVAAGGVALVGIAAYHFHKAYTANFQEIFRPGISEYQSVWTTRIGRVGYVARGVLYLIIGGLLLEAAWYYDPEQAGGLGDALASLAAHPYGLLFLGAVALGLMAYGVYSIMMGKFRDFGF